ncbi:hypothetical protein [Duganella sp.]|uniref:hypothetical protein n=1 Tax=Duganella sp. TaxID=1904440 RepID=UPI0031D24F00
MNGDNQSQQEHHHIAERVAHLETAVRYQGKAIAELREDMPAGFVRTEAELVRVHEQLTKIRTTDFRILLSISLTTALGTLGIIVRMLGWFQ